MDVPRHGVQVLVAVYQDAVESTAEQRSVAAMTSVEPLCVDLTDVFECSAQL